MSILSVGNQHFTCAELLPLMAEYGLLAPLVRELLIDRAIATIECTAEEVAAARQQFYQQQGITTEAEQQTWLKRHRLTPNQLGSLSLRLLKLEKFKQQTWANRLEAYFLTHKSKLDKVTCSIIRTQNAALAQELFFRIQAGEQSFAELAHIYSEGPEAKTGGFLGPVPLSRLHPALAQKLTTAQPGQLCPLMKLENWILIVRLEKLIPAQLDETTRQSLLNELFETWIQTAMDTEPWSLRATPVPISTST